MQEHHFPQEIICGLHTGPQSPYLDMVGSGTGILGAAVVWRRVVWLTRFLGFCREIWLQLGAQVHLHDHLIIILMGLRPVWKELNFYFQISPRPKGH